MTSPPRRKPSLDGAHAKLGAANEHVGLLQASIDLSVIEEVEYDDELATGRSVPDGHRALRLRSHGAAFEFIMPAAEALKWQAALPGRQAGGQPATKVS